MKRISFSDRLHYWFDNTMSRGTIALIGWLFVLSALLVLVVSAVVVATGIAPPADDGQPLSFAQVAWLSLMRTLDPGTMGGDVGSWAFLLAMFVVTIGGIFIVSTLIGVLTSGIEGKLEELRKGRSFVIEEGHTVILGWSPQVFTIVAELVIANANQPRACIAILAEKDKVEMEDEIAARVGQTGRTRIVCRTGSPMEMSDLEIVNPHGARAIIVLSPESDDPDAQVIKTLLALVNNPQRRSTPYHIVAGIRDRRNVEVARLAGRDEVELVVSDDLIARIMGQTCRQSGLSVVYNELLDFGGDEIYFQEEPALVGKTFREALLAYEDSAVMGLCDKDGRVRLNPPMDTRIEPGDQVIAISEDDDTVRLSGLSEVPVEPGAVRVPVLRPQPAERTLVLGWNRRLATVLHHLDEYVAAGSEVLVVADDEEVGAELAREYGDLQRQTVSFRQGDTTNRRTLEALDLESFDHIIVLSYSDRLDVQQADACTLITLLHLRSIAEQAGTQFPVVSEMLDVRNRELAEVTRADDFIVSDQLVSLMLAQLSENPKLAPVFADLFDPEGSELYLKPAEDYVEPDRPLSFYTVVEAAAERGEVALGYRLRAEAADAAKAYGVHLNPAKSAPVTFSVGDRIIVLAEA